MPRKRDTEKYYENPFIKTMIEHMQRGVKPMYVQEKSNGEQLIIVNKEDGEIISQAGIFARKPVDKSQFAKIYVEGVGAIINLNSAGKQIFLIIFKRIASAQGMGKTEIILNYEELAKQAEAKKEKIMSAATFYRGIKNCIEKNIIAESMVPSRYFINPQFIFNGNRLTIANEYYINENEELQNSAKKLRSRTKK